ncbi:MAG: peptidase family protein, partial [Ilumatobacteraceae bacterium]|nr:peptidase family protein [Ilumatobacteraceae bacterium]
GGRVALVVGVIHGDETKGELITRELRTMAVPPDVDLWVIDSVNPDGEALGTRQNANHVDLNRNFEVNWRPIAPSATGESAGRGPADQPETAAIEAFILEIQPQISIWWHQASNRVSLGGARPEIPSAYAQLVGQRVAGTPCVSGCTGTETQFTNTVIPTGTAFIVELPTDTAVTSSVVRLHAAAVMTVIAM